ncbi:MAG: succinate--CoA ligase subunit alpha [Candidatus Bathyarchaeia archaeon]
MGVLIDAETRVLVQGITGTQGSFHTRLMLAYGTRVVAGTSPGKGGVTVEGVPVYDTVAEAQKTHDVDASIVFVPAPNAADAALEALESGIKLVVTITEHVPVKDAIELMYHAHRVGAVVVGPNTPGVIAPGRCKLGIMPARAFTRGGVGVASRSGTLTYEIADSLTKHGLGQSTCVGLGGDPVTGLSFVDALRMFRQDAETEAVVLVGEIGGNLEEEAAEYVKREGYSKPVVAYVAGRAAPAEKRMGHAGAIIMGRSGTAQSKVEAFKAAGVRVAAKPSDVARLLAEAFLEPP